LLFEGGVGGVVEEIVEGNPPEAQIGVEQEKNKVFVVVQPHTVADPETVVVHSEKGIGVIRERRENKGNKGKKKVE
jgi:hypothetical protein